MSEELPKTERIAKNKREQQRRDAVVREQVIRTLMGHPDGRRYVWMELEKGNVFSQTYVPDSFDITAFQEGKRSIALALLAEVTRWTPADYLRMSQENAAVAVSLEEENINE